MLYVNHVAEVLAKGEIVGAGAIDEPIQYGLTMAGERQEYVFILSPYYCSDMSTLEECRPPQLL